MPRLTAIRLRVEVGPDRTIKLPEGVPVEPAEVLVLVAGAAPARPTVGKSLLGLFAEEPEVVRGRGDGVHLREARALGRAPGE